MPKKFHPPKDPSNIAQFIIQKLEENNLTFSEFAEGANLSTSYLSEVIHGKKIPSAKILNDMADFLETPRIILYKLMDWINFEEDEDHFIATLVELAKTDPLLEELVEVYLNLENDDDRKKLQTLIRSSYGK